ncbi:MAG: anthranilate synthase component I family protein [Proteobacteria bacterium]|nr:anthranilate synthase component I family protein [Pseudomonadota bacterium]
MTPDCEAVAWALRDEPDLCWIDRGERGFFVWGATASADSIEAGRALLRPATRRSGEFVSGVVGYVGYEAGREVERMPEPIGSRLLPDVGLRRYEGALRYDGTIWSTSGPPSFCSRARRALAEAGAPPRSRATGRVVDVGDPAAFVAGVERVLRWIAEGDHYQVNLARALRIAGVGDPLLAWLRLRPATWGAFLAVPGGHVLSSSPELFLRIRDGRVVSRPIKGTRPVGLEAELEMDPKERAELTMIVDLVRNDLGRICVPGSVVAGPRTLRALPTLLHAEQEVSGELAGDAFDAIAAAFPPGSVTGAPKVQAMARIRELEPVPRGVYTGAIGWFDDGGDAELSVAIRTATVVDDVATVHVGCGLVADSIPARELEESDLKAKALVQALVNPLAAASTSSEVQIAEMTAQA